MRTNSGRTSAIAAARRQQIVRAAIEVLARDGMPQASFQRIAKAAELSSPGMISYHFADKQDLMLSVVADVRAVWQVIRNFAADPMDPGPTVIDKDAQLRPLRDLLEAGIAAGVFRPVNTAWVAGCIYGSVTGFIDLADHDPEIDAEAYLAELQRLYAGALAIPARTGDR